MNGKTEPGSPRRRGRPPKDEANDTRERILDAALGLFAREGFAGAPIRRIAWEVGVTESAIYAHFESKREIYETLMAQAGPTLVLDVLESGEDFAGKEPATFLRELVWRVFEAWEEPRTRLFASVLMQESGTGSAVGGTSLVGAIEEVQSGLGEVFRRWMEAGLVRGDFPAEHLVWELFHPLAYVRLLYLHAQATEEERRAGRRLAEKHLGYFLACVLRDPKSGNIEG